MRELIPLGNKVLIRPSAVVETIGEGILVKPEAYKQPPGDGKVVAVGPGRYDFSGRLIAPDVAIGDKVVYNWINGKDVVLDGVTLKLLDADEILGKFKA